MTTTERVLIEANVRRARVAGEGLAQLDGVLVDLGQFGELGVPIIGVRIETVPVPESWDLDPYRYSQPDWQIVLELAPAPSGHMYRITNNSAYHGTAAVSASKSP